MNYSSHNIVALIDGEAYIVKQISIDMGKEMDEQGCPSYKSFEQKEHPSPIPNPKK